MKSLNPVRHALLLLLAGAIPLSAAPPESTPATDSSPGLVKTFFQDGAYLATSPLRLQREDMAVVAGVAVSIVGISLLDRTVRDHLVSSKDTTSAKHLRKFGDAMQFAGPVIGTGFALQGWQTGNAKSKETAYLSYESYLWSGAICAAIKYVVGRKRPEASDGDPFQFKFGEKNASFPSGHTTVAFAAATVFSEQYPCWQVAVPAYGLAATVGFSRLYADQHWLSDVVGGAILGFTVSHTLRKRHRATKSLWSLRVEPEAIRLVRTF